MDGRAEGIEENNILLCTDGPIDCPNNMPCSELDASCTSPSSGTNTMDGTSLNWNGGDGEDRVDMQFVSAGTTNLNLFGDTQGSNSVVLRCAEVNCTRECYSLPRLKSLMALPLTSSYAFVAFHSYCCISPEQKKHFLPMCITWMTQKLRWKE